MTKRDRMNADYAKVQARLGKTTGASKGKAALPKPKVKPTGSMKKPGVKVTYKF
jgi:hypothetical protein